MIAPILLFSALQIPSVSDAPFSFADRETDCIGVYEANDGNRLIFAGFPGSTLPYFTDTATGQFHLVEATDTPRRYRFSALRNVADDTAGHVACTLSPDGAAETLTISMQDSGPSLQASAIPLQVEDIAFSNGSEASLAGWLITPNSPGPYPATVIVTQSDRFDLLDIALSLAADGFAVLVYDQRNANGGASTGEDVSGWYHETQPVYAGDASAAIDYLRTREEIRDDAIGVIGWSGGGWMAGMVAARDPELAFYINVAGNVSPFLEQAEHRLVARLYREGFDAEEVAEAEAFLNQHHDLARGQGSWEDYASARDRVEATGWYQFLTSNFSITYSDLDDARAWGRSSEAVHPTDGFGEISAATLGIFFEFDHSTPPSSPGIFSEALRGSDVTEFDVVTLPGLNHGAWVVPGGYRWTSGEIEYRSPDVIALIRDWAIRHAG